MVFNEILIPQDSFTETNVTRKRVHRRKFLNTFQNHFNLNFPFCFYILFGNMEDNDNIT